MVFIAYAKSLWNNRIYMFMIIMRGSRGGGGQEVQIPPMENINAKGFPSNIKSHSYSVRIQCCSTRETPFNDVALAGRWWSTFSGVDSSKTKNKSAASDKTVWIIWDNISCYRFYLPDYIPWILTTLATYLLKSVASITQKSIQTFK